MIMSAPTIPTHMLAVKIMHIIDCCLDRLGFDKVPVVEETIYVALMCCVSVFIGWCIKSIVLFVTRRVVRYHETATGRDLLRLHTLEKCSHVIPPLVFMGLMPIAFTMESTVMKVVMKVVGVYSLVAFAIAVSAVLTFFFERFNERENTKQLPIRGTLNVAIGVVWIVIVILSVSWIVGKSPAVLLGALGAFAAALMLIFKDSILGFVAGLQMSKNDMLHIGDWIVVPSTIANGVVIDVTLSTVKVQNWDNTIVMVPPHVLVSTCFQNWRGMKDSGVRRIDYTVNVDTTTMRQLDDTTTDAIVAKYPVLKPFVDSMRAAGKSEQSAPGLRPVNGTITTNLGLFRAYVAQYLVNNPDISADQQILVNVQPANEFGLPLQIYCFTATTDWNAYEAILSAIIEHIATAIRDFAGLDIYSASSLTVSAPTDK